eukprot:g1271.t1
MDYKEAKRKCKSLKKELKAAKAGDDKALVKKIRAKYKASKERLKELEESGADRATAVADAIAGKRPRTRSISIDLTTRPRTRSFDLKKSDVAKDTEKSGGESQGVKKKRKQNNGSAASKLASAWLGEVPSATEKKAPSETETSSTTEVEILATPDYMKKHDIEIRGTDASSMNLFQTFSETPFPSKLKDALKKAGFAAPTPIQTISWPIVISGRDIISVARTGSGKTCGFLLPAFVHIMKRLETCRLACGEGPFALVLAPTRELACQIQVEAMKFGSALAIRSICVYGGAPKRKQISNLRRSPTHLLIATPGRLNDLLNIQQASVKRVSMFILDEADRMLDMGFAPQIDAIVSHLTPQTRSSDGSHVGVRDETSRQTLYYTATWPKKVEREARKLLRNPVQVNIGSSNQLVANEDVQQIVKVIDSRNKLEELMTIVRSLSKETKIIIFIGRKRDCDSVADTLWNEGYKCDSIHGDKDQYQRNRVLGQFKKTAISVLCATDVAARGLDVKDIDVVINYDFPLQKGAGGIEDYVHRIGRTGRAGAKGVAYTLFTRGDRKSANDLVKLLEHAKQDVPSELNALRMSNRGGGGRRGGWGGRGRRGRGRGRGRGRRY